MPDNNKEFKTVSVANGDYDFYDNIRREFAKANGIDPKKVSMATILKVGMTFYNQRRKFIKEGESSEA